MKKCLIDSDIEHLDIDFENNDVLIEVSHRQDLCSGLFDSGFYKGKSNWLSLCARFSAQEYESGVRELENTGSCKIRGYGKSSAGFMLNEEGARLSSLTAEDGSISFGTGERFGTEKLHRKS